MDANALIAYVKSLLGNITSSDWDAQVLRDLQMAQTMLEGEPLLPWFLSVEKEVTCTALESRLEVPTDFLQEDEESALWLYVEGKYTALQKAPDDYLRAVNATLSAGKPEAYSLRGTYFHLYPVPDAEYVFRMRYLKQDTTLAVDGATNLWATHLPDLLIATAAEKTMIHYRSEPQVAAQIGQMKAEAQFRFRNMMTAREMKNRDLDMGSL